MRQMTFFVDLNKCVGCRSCEAACAVSWGTKPGASWRRVGTVEAGDFPTFTRLFLSVACNHCEAPACMYACPTDAYTKREDGVVIVDPDRCIGCKYCTWACPYGAPQYDEEARVITKCHFCAPLLDRGEAPRCVATCPYEALDYGPKFEVIARHPDVTEAAPLFPDPAITRPNILFRLPEDMPESKSFRRIDAVGRLAERRPR